MPKGEQFNQHYSVFSFIAAFRNRTLAKQHRHPMKNICINVSGHQHLSNRYSMEHEQELQFSNTFQHHIQKFKALMKEAFDDYCETNLYTTKLHLRDRVIDSLDRFGCFEMLSSLAYERFNIYMKGAYRSSSQRLTSAPAENLSAVNVALCNKRQSLHKTRLTVRSAVSEKVGRVSTTGSHLVKDSSNKRLIILISFVTGARFIKC